MIFWSVGVLSCLHKIDWRCKNVYLREKIYILPVKEMFLEASVQILGKPEKYVILACCCCVQTNDSIPWKEKKPGETCLIRIWLVP